MAIAPEQPKRPKVIQIPLCFLGLAFYRAWIDVTLAGDTCLLARGEALPAAVFLNLFDVPMMLVLAGLALGARYCTPLYANVVLRRLCPVLMVGATALGWASSAGWVPAGPAAVVALVAGGVGSALAVLLWCELYGDLNPIRTCLYFSLSLVLSAVIVWLAHGLEMDRRFAVAAALPLASMAALHRCREVVGSDGVAAPDWASFTFPWKPIAVTGIFALAFGLQWETIQGVESTYSSAGTLVCAGAIALPIVLFKDKVDYETTYRLRLPVVAVAFLTLSSLSGLDPVVRNFCASFGYCAVEIFIMTMLSSIVYQWGVSAVWLFGIARTIRAFSVFAGRTAADVAGLSGAAGTAAVVGVLAVGTLILMGERSPNPTWGIKLRPEDGPGATSLTRERNALASACAELSRRRGLSQRESEVLVLLARGRSTAEIERELIIANGTVKAHVSRIYRKLGVHCRSELDELVASCGSEGEGEDGAL